MFILINMSRQRGRRCIVLVDGYMLIIPMGYWPSAFFKDFFFPSSCCEHETYST
jgi:hypothetical protein